MATSELTTSAPVSKARSWRTDWSRSFTVYCATAAQKERLQAEATKRNRSLSNYALHALMTSAGQDGATAEELQEARDAAAQNRRSAEEATARAGAATERIRELEAQLDEIHRRPSHLSTPRGGGEVTIRCIHPEALRILADARDEAGQQLPVQESDLIIALDRVADVSFTKRLQEDLAVLTEYGLVARGSRQGRTRHRWIRA